VHPKPGPAPGFLLRAIAEAVATGEVAPVEAASPAKVVEGYAQALELHDLEAHVTELERQDMAKRRGREDGMKAPTQP
jgi:hypothetical protein